jgi:hypothetical protein
VPARGVDVQVVAAFELANDHSRGKCPKQRAIGATGGQFPFTGHNVLFTGVVIAGAETHHQKRFFHVLFLTE